MASPAMTDHLTYHPTRHPTFFLRQRSAASSIDFRGGDDGWVLVNRRLALDLGGQHRPQSGSIRLDTLDLTKGDNYNMAIFHAERQCCGSKFCAPMSLRKDQSVCANQCCSIAEQGATSGRCAYRPSVTCSLSIYIYISSPSSKILSQAVTVTGFSKFCFSYNSGL